MAAKAIVTHRILEYSRRTRYVMYTWLVFKHGDVNYQRSLESYSIQACAQAKRDVHLECSRVFKEVDVTYSEVEFGKTGRSCNRIFQVYFDLSIPQNISEQGACADPYSGDFGPEYLAFCTVLGRTECQKSVRDGLLRLPILRAFLFIDWEKFQEKRGFRGGLNGSKFKTYASDRLHLKFRNFKDCKDCRQCQPM